MSERAAFPERPALPLTFLLFLATFAGARAALWGGEAAVPWGVAASGGVLAAGLLMRGRGPALRGATLVALALALGLGLGTAARAANEAAAETLARTPVSEFEFRAEGASSQGSYSWRTTAAAVLDGRRVGTVWLATDGPLDEGSAVTGVGTFSALSDDDFGRSARARGVLGTVRLVRVATEAPTGLRGVLADVKAALLGQLDLEDPGHALASGMLLGEKAALKALGVSDDFSGAGLAHLTAVSGTHVALVAALASAALARLPLPRAAKGLGALVSSGLYVALCGAPAPALRAWAMSAGSFGSSLVFRRAHPLAALGAVALCFVAWDPCVTGDLGFSLSVACVAGIALVAPWFRAWIATLAPVPAFRGLRAAGRRRASSAWRDVGSQAATSVACSAASAPLCAGAFSSLAMLGPVANLVVGPLVGPFLGLGLGALVLAPVPVMGDLALGTLSVAGGLIVWFAGWVAALPFAQLPVSLAEPWPQLLTVLVLLGLWAWWPRPREGASHRFAPLKAAAVCGCLALLGLVATLGSGPSVTVLDVGQGDAILVRDGTHAVLVDTGPDDAVAAALARCGVHAVDAVVLTHQHDDHVGGLASLAGHCAVGQVLVGEGTEPVATVADACGRLGVSVVEARAGDAVSVGSWRLRVLWPRAPCDGSENEHSLCLALERDGEVWGLLTGDAESDTLAQLLPGLPRLAFLKVGHHGSAVSITADQARALAPMVAVASAGEGNSYGHPTEECVEALEGAGAVFLCTKDVGDVRLLPDGSGVRLDASLGPGAFAYD